jgi:SAM-dependent methyltransferase
MTDAVERFYSELAENYHFIFADWRKSVLRQSAVLDRMLRGTVGGVGRSVLDCACGIGTQAIGLAVRGYQVQGTDLSTEAIERARREASSFDVDMTFAVADFRQLETVVSDCFDAVICCDNALAHMQAEDDLRAALSSIYDRVTPGGLLLASIRDYDRLVADQPRSTLPVVTDYNGAGRSVVFQVWDWDKAGTGYTVNHFTLREKTDGSWQTHCSTSVLRAWQRADISAALESLGANTIDWHMPEDSGYYQPIVTARKPE